MGRSERLSMAWWHLHKEVAQYLSNGDRGAAYNICLPAELSLVTGRFDGERGRAEMISPLSDAGPTHSVRLLPFLFIFEDWGHWLRHLKFQDLIVCWKFYTSLPKAWWQHQKAQTHWVGSKRLWQWKKGEEEIETNPIYLSVLNQRNVAGNN